MEILVFAKKRKKADGGTFNSYITTLTTKEGEERAMAVKFREDCPAPKADKCPCYIDIVREESNVSRKKYIREDTGEEAYGYTLWVGNWKPIEKEYKDTSMEEYI